MYCGNCKYFNFIPPQVIPNLHFIGDVQQATVIEHEYDGECEHPDNWRPSRGNMPCDVEYKCKYFMAISN
jgi:hypothetical protein